MEAIMLNAPPKDQDIVDASEPTDRDQAWGPHDPIALVIVPTPLQRQGVGRPPFTTLEKHLRACLAASAYQSIQLLAGAGFSMDEARDVVGDNITAMSPRVLEEEGRNAIPDLFGCSADTLKRYSLQQYADKGPMRGETKRNEAKAAATSDLPVLNKAFLRARRLLAEQRKNGGGLLQIREAIDVATSERLELLECLQLSFVTGVNAAYLYAPFWYYRIVFGAACGLSPAFRGQPSTLNARQLYTLYRLATGPATHYAGHENARQCIVTWLDLTCGRDRFVREVEHILADDPGEAFQDVPSLNAWAVRSDLTCTIGRHTE